MKTIKVIDLLNKIANGEEVPNIILFNSYKYRFDKIDRVYRNIKGNCTLGTINELDLYLNEEVEIIKEPRNIEVCGSLFTKSEYDELAKSKEDKKIEKMDFCYKVADEMQNANNERFKDFINEIIDKVNGEDNE